MSKKFENELEGAYTANIVGSPLQSMNENGTDNVTPELLPYYIRNLRDPIPDTTVEHYAELFESVIFGDGSDNQLRQRRLTEAEQYFSRLGLLNAIWKSEAGLNHGLRVHVIGKPGLESVCREIEMEKNLRKKSYIPELALALLTKIVSRKSDHTFLDAFGRYKSRLECYLLKPLFTFRHGICHANMRAYIDFKRNQPGAANHKDADGRAEAIFQKMDAIVLNVLETNYWRMFYEMVYIPLSEDTEDKAFQSLEQYFWVLKMRKLKDQHYLTSKLHQYNGKVDWRFYGEQVNDAMFGVCRALDNFLIESGRYLKQK